MLAVLYGGGLRRGELCRLDFADFDVTGRALTVRGGKGGRQRVVYLNRGACRYMQTWIKERGGEPGPLFCPVSAGGQVRISRMRGETLWYILRKRMRQAGVSGITPHSLGRSFVTSLLDAGVDVFTVQRMAGHADAVTTARYDRRGETVRRTAARVLSLPTTC